MTQSKTSAIFYDGVMSKAQPAEVYAIDAQNVMIRYGENLEYERRYAYENMQLIGALGQIKPVIEFNDDARLEFQSALPEWFQLERKEVHHSVWKLERSPSLIFFSVLFVIGLAFATITWGIPTASYHVAHQLPADTLNSIGNRAEQYVMEMTKESQLPKARQDELRAHYLKLAGDRPAKLLFREGDKIGANALAIPNNTIVLTDELVALAQDDREIIGVLAHEQGHLVNRHSMQQVLAGLGFSAIVILITGDSSDLITTLPVALVGASYSRHFENEADDYALHSMHQHQIPTSYFGEFLERLAQDTGEDTEAEESVFDFFSSHPATRDRIDAVKNFEANQVVQP